MKLSQVFSAFLVAESVSAAYDRLFYAKYNGFLVPLSMVNTHEHKLLVLQEPTLPSAPKFEFRNGIATTRDSNDKEVFGFANNDIVFGKSSKVKSLKLRVGSNYKVTNFHPKLCRYMNKRFRGFLMLNTPTEDALECSSVDLYLMPPGEAEKHGPVSNGRHRRNARGTKGKSVH